MAQTYRITIIGPEHKCKHSSTIFLISITLVVGHHFLSLSSGFVLPIGWHAFESALRQLIRFPRRIASAKSIK